VTWGSLATGPRRSVGGVLNSAQELRESPFVELAQQSLANGNLGSRLSCVRAWFFQLGVGLHRTNRYF
jgi:hypothetical protein